MNTAELLDSLLMVIESELGLEVDRISDEPATFEIEDAITGRRWSLVLTDA